MPRSALSMRTLVVTPGPVMFLILGTELRSDRDEDALVGPVRDANAAVRIHRGSRFNRDRSAIIRRFRSAAICPPSSQEGAQRQPGLVDIRRAERRGVLVIGVLVTKRHDTRRSPWWYVRPLVGGHDELDAAQLGLVARQ